MIPLYVWFVWPILALPVAVAVLRDRDAWPFSRYPMFSRRVRPEDMVVFRIALESADGQVNWWRPHYFRLPDRLCARFAALARTSAPNALASPAFFELADEARRLILADGAEARECAAVLFVRRRVRSVERRFEPDDEVVARFLLPMHAPLDGRRAPS